MNQPGTWLAILLVVSSTVKMNTSPVLVNRETEYFPVPVRAWELFGFARRPVLPQPAHSPHSGWMWCLLTGFLLLPAAVSIYLHYQPSWGQSRAYRVTQLRTDGIHCLGSFGTVPVVLKIVPVTGAAFSGIIMDHNGRLYFPTSTFNIGM